MRGAIEQIILVPESRDEQLRMGRAYVYVAGRTRAAPATEGQKIVEARVTDRLEQCYPGLARNSAQRSVALGELDRYHCLCSR